VLAIALVALGAWIVHRFLAALAWAGVLAIALWPLYRRVASALPGGKSRILAPLLVTLAVGLVFTVPFIYVAIEGAREVRIVVHFLGEAEHNGVPVPEWVSQLPVVGRAVEEWWRANLSDPNAAQELLGKINPRPFAASARLYGAHRALCGLPRLGKRGQEDADQDGNDADHRDLQDHHDEALLIQEKALPDKDPAE